MGTTSDKLTYLNTTKQKLKDSINALGGDITSETTFRAYATELDNIYTNLPKTTGEGSNLSLSPTLKGKLNIEAYKGDTQQEGTPTPSTPIDIEVVTGTQEVVVQTKNLAYIEAEGKYRSSSSGNFSTNANYNGYIAKVSQNTTYSGSFTNMASNYNDVSNLCYFDKNMNFISGNAYNTANKTFTTPSNCAYVTMAVKTNIVDFQLEYGSTATSYVEHQEQTKTLHLSSSNKLDQATILTPASNVGIAINSNGNVYDTSPTGDNRTSSYANSNWQLKLPSGTYAISFNFLTQATNSNAVCHIYNSSNTLLLNGSLANKNSYSGTFTLAEETEIGIFSKIYDGVVNIMLNEGSTALPYEPYYNYELCKIGTYKNRIFETSRKNKYDSNNVIENALIQPSLNKIGATTECTTIWFKCTPNTTYTLSRDKGDRLVIGGSNTQPALNGEITTLYDIGASEDKTYTFNSGNFEYVAIYISRYNTSKPTIIMINEGSTALPYEPYGSDKWYIEKKMYKIANKTNWVVGNIASNNRCPIPLNSNGLADTINNYNGINCISNCLIATSQRTQATSTDINTISINNANAYVKFDDATNTKELVKAKLDSMTNFVLYYILITPTYEEITNETLLNELNELEKMMSYSGQTNISISGNLPMILDVTALKGESE